MKIKNYELDDFIKFLFDLKLVGKSSRMRTRLIRLLGEKFQLFQIEREEIARTYAKKENGEPVTRSENGSTVYVIEEVEAANKDLSELSNEVVIIEKNEENKDMLLSVKDSILNFSDELSGQQASLYDRFCEVVEEIKYEQ